MTRSSFAFRHALMGVLLLVPALLAAAELNGAAKAGHDPAETVDLFDGIKSGALDAKLYPRDEFAANVVIRNTTQRPLSVRLPEAFAGVPVLAQRNGPGGNNGRGANGGNQAVGAGPNQPNQLRGNAPGGQPNGIFNIAPEQVGQFRVSMVCLEHGKTAPRAGMTYAVKPLNMATTAPGVRELLVSLAQGQVSERVAQAAAWHLANDLSWDDLKNKRVEHLDGSSERWFTADELAAAKRAVEHVGEEHSPSAERVESGTK